MYRGERFNGYSHLAGTLLAIVAATVLIVYGANHGDVWKVVSFSIYGATLIVLFASSTLYHSTRGMTKNVFRKFDHSAIYLLIAGTYTPFTSGHAARAVGLGIVRCGVGAGAGRHRPGADGGARRALDFAHHLYRDGLGRRGRRGTDDRIADLGRIYLGGDRRRGLHRRHRVLYLRR